MSAILGLTRPQAERRLILLSAGTAARRRDMREPARRLAAEVDWLQLGETLRRRKLLPVLGPRILDLAGGSAGGGFAAAVERALEESRRQGVFLQLVSLHLIASLAEAGVRSAALKGPLLAEAIYGDPGRRLSSDIDLLVILDDDAPREKLTLAARNLPHVELLAAAAINPVSLARHDKVLATVGAVKLLEERLQ